MTKMTNRQAGDYLMTRVVDLVGHDSDYNQAVIRGAIALLVTDSKVIDDLYDCFIEKFKEVQQEPNDRENEDGGCS